MEFDGNNSHELLFVEGDTICCGLRLSILQVLFPLFQTITIH